VKTHAHYIGVYTIQLELGAKACDRLDII